MGETARPGSNRRPTGYSIGLRSPSSVPSTAEDDLPPSGGYIRAPTRRIPISIAAPLASRNPLIGASVARYLLVGSLAWRGHPPRIEMGCLGARFEWHRSQKIRTPVTIAAAGRAQEQETQSVPLEARASPRYVTIQAAAIRTTELAEKSQPETGAGKSVHRARLRPQGRQTPNALL